MGTKFCKGIKWECDGKRTGLFRWRFGQPELMGYAIDDPYAMPPIGCLVQRETIEFDQADGQCRFNQGRRRP